MHHEILDTMDLLARRAADVIEEEIDRAKQLALGLAGGSTPAGTYRELSHRPIDWSHTTSWITDERWVGPSHSDANQAMARAMLVDQTGIRLLAPDTTMASPLDSAHAFSELLETQLTPGTRMVTLLGIGSDGHTASLFPGTDAIGATGALYVANRVPALDTWRLTATFDLIARSDVVIFLVSGSSKAQMISDIAGGRDVPATRVTAKERVLWLLDRGAADAL
ncbi:MAG: 6-phosphogluconolactonase [Actinomycetia bacterium]|nr:6-phosphogluconolactonase [Actinomycetes bacterium]